MTSEAAKVPKKERAATATAERMSKKRERRFEAETARLEEMVSRRKQLLAQAERRLADWKARKP